MMDGNQAGAIVISVVFTLSGILAILAALMNWDWFFNTRNARMLVGRCSRRTARLVYFVIGVLILAMVAAMHLRLAGRI